MCRLYNIPGSSLENLIDGQDEGESPDLLFSTCSRAYPLSFLRDMWAPLSIEENRETFRAPVVFQYKCSWALRHVMLDWSMCSMAWALMRRKTSGAWLRGSGHKESWFESLGVNMNARLGSRMWFTAVKGHSTLQGIFTKQNKVPACPLQSRGLKAVLKDFSRSTEDSYLHSNCRRPISK